MKKDLYETVINHANEHYPASEWLFNKLDKLYMYMAEINPLMYAYIDLAKKEVNILICQYAKKNNIRN